jgi:hypothetical protein
VEREVGHPVTTDCHVDLDLHLRLLLRLGPLSTLSFSALSWHFVAAEENTNCILTVNC